MLKRLSTLILTSLFALSIWSCNRIKRKGKEVVKQTWQSVAEKKADLENKLITRFDAHQPDTKFNKKRFSDFFGFPPTEDVKNLYCHADEMGIDHDYQFAFNCNSITVSKIVSSLKLVKKGQPDNFSSGLWHNYQWWDSATVATLMPYYKKGDYETHWYLWYDSSKAKAYYFQFDM